ncbi:MAG: hypothetical protein H6538_02855 [Bacteroidales bacterium]|nr:hypothetical protein [Bacteroidales bacterium]
MPENTLLYKIKNSLDWRALVVLLFVLLPLHAFSQETEIKDTTTYDESYKQDSAYHSPKKASVYSAVLPGLGQIYNKKYWKVPIVYAGFGTFAFFIHYNQKGYIKWRDGYLHALDDDPTNDLKYDFPLTLDQIERTKNSYKRFRDLSIIGTGAFYILQIIDATVDAYLFDWSVSDDISLRIEPSVIPAPSLFPVPATNTFALKASLSF